MASASCTVIRLGLFARRRVTFMTPWAKAGMWWSATPNSLRCLRDPKVVDQLADGLDHAACALALVQTPGRLAEDFGDFCELGEVPQHVKLHDRRQHDAVRNPVGDVELGPDRVGKSVHGRDPRVGEGHPGQQTPLQHAGARRQILAVRVGFPDVAENKPHGLARKDVADRVRVLRREGLDRMDQGIEPGCRRDPRRHPQRELRIQDRNCREKPRADDSFFEFFVFIAQDRDRGDLAPRACRGRDQNGRKPCLGHHVDPEKLAHGLGIRRQYGANLGDVERRAAADADHEFRLFAFRGFDRPDGDFESRVRLDLIEAGPADAGLREDGLEP